MNTVLKKAKEKIIRMAYSNQEGVFNNSLSKNLLSFMSALLSKKLTLKEIEQLNECLKEIVCDLTDLDLKFILNYIVIKTNKNTDDAYFYYYLFDNYKMLKDINLVKSKELDCLNNDIVDKFKILTNKNEHYKNISKKERFDSNGLIMVVDDSLTVRKCVKKFLKENNYCSVMAFDGEDAKGKIMYTMPDLILLDVEMLRMDGFSFAEYVKGNENLKHIPIIMITSKVAEKYKKKAIEIGIEDYQAKPFNKKILSDSLKRFLI